MSIVHVNLWSTVLEMKVYLSHSISDDNVMPIQNSEWFDNFIASFITP